MLQTKFQVLPLLRDCLSRINLEMVLGDIRYLTACDCRDEIAEQRGSVRISAVLVSGRNMDRFPLSWHGHQGIVGALSTYFRMLAIERLPEGCSKRAKHQFTTLGDLGYLNLRKERPARRKKQVSSRCEFRCGRITAISGGQITSTTAINLGSRPTALQSLVSSAWTKPGVP